MNPLIAQADQVDDFITGRMLAHSIHGISLAILQDGKITKAKGYGFTDKSAKTPVTTTTLFQAGSISKSVAAVGALALVQKGTLSLDADVNIQLRSWKVPENEFTRDKKVTLRGILSHSAGLTVHGFPGYPVDGPIPTLPQVLAGSAPANTPAIRVDILPGTKWRYSGGGYTVMQQLVIDVTGEPFPKFMQATVLKPLGMDNSTYEQPLPPDLAANTASGHYPKDEPVKGRWHIYPEMAAAGLWTTASDLARFEIGIQKAFAGDPHAVLTRSTARQLLTDQNPSLSKEDGLGVFLKSSGRTLQFYHGGRDAGFDALMLAYATKGQGAVLLMNANDDSGVAKEIFAAIARQYKWEAFDAKSLD